MFMSGRYRLHCCTIASTVLKLNIQKIKLRSTFYWIYWKRCTRSIQSCNKTYLKRDSAIGGAWWLIGRFIAFRPKGRGFESRSDHHKGTLGKSFTCSCLWHFEVKLQHSIRAVFGVPLSSSGLEEISGMNEWMIQRCSWPKSETNKTVKNRSQMPSEQRKRKGEEGMDYT